ncbi:glutathione S-transferase like protein [Mycena vulgaris]|nr:glutathione S-transferase like protein [Mycena vulgaris]KAJ6605210.1 glutathione S-transferase like protein [Mycena vulgaris]
MLIIHHLQRSQSERIVWLCEELGLPYELKIYQRDRQTLLAPAELKALYPCGTAPLMEDGTVKFSESSAIMEYIVQKYARTTLLNVLADEPGFADFIYWYHYGIGSLQPVVGRLLARRSVADDNPFLQRVDASLKAALTHVDGRLRDTGAYLAGTQCTLADIYAEFTLSTMRLFTPFSLDGYDGVYAWLQRVAERPAYKRLIEKAEQGEERGVFPTIMKEAPKFFNAP